MVDLRRAAEAAEHRLGRQPVTADDTVAMISDVLYGYLPPDSGVSVKEAIGRLVAIIETPLALEMYEREMQRRQPRDADRWH